MIQCGNVQYRLRIIKVSPILLSQFLLSQILLSLTRRVIAALDFVYSRVCMRKERNILQSFIVSCPRTTLYVTHQFMHDYIVKSSIASKIAQKATHIDTSTSENTKACAIVSTKIY